MSVCLMGVCLSKASALENLFMHTEGDQTHITNDAETIRKLLKRESVSKELQKERVKLEEICKELKESNKELEDGQKTLKKSSKELEESCKKPQKRARDHEEQARLRALVEMDLRCNNIRKSLLACIL